MARIGYVRALSNQQSAAQQIESLQDVEKLYIDVCTTRDASRPRLKAMMEYLREGDTVVVESIERFGRGSRDFLLLMEQLGEKGVDFISLKEDIDTAAEEGMRILALLQALMRMERNHVRQGQLEGVARAKGEGKYKGRKPIAVDEKRFMEICGKWRRGEMTARQAMELLNLKANTFYRRVKEMGV